MNALILASFLQFAFLYGICMTQSYTNLDFSKLLTDPTERPLPKRCQVTGAIPYWLSGSLLRNGAGMFKVGSGEFAHAFDGLALIQKFTIDNGSVWYSSKYLRSDAYKQNMAAGKIVVSEFGTKGGNGNPFTGYSTSFFPKQYLTDNAAVNFLKLGDEIYALTETPNYHRIDPRTLDSVQKVSVQDYVAINSITAHPHYDEDENAINVASGNYQYYIVKIPKPETNAAKGNSILKTHIINSIRMENWRRPSYYHSFGVTSNYILLPEKPLKVNVVRLMEGTVSYDQALEWDATAKTKLNIVPLYRGSLSPVPKRRILTDGMFIFHHANTFEQDGFLVADFVAYPDSSIFGTLYMAKFTMQPTSENEIGYLQRLVIPLDISPSAMVGEDLLAKFSGHRPSGVQAILQPNGDIFVTPGRLSRIPIELPRYNYESKNGRPYRFVYGTTLHHNVREALVKVDVKGKGDDASWQREGAGQLGCEPVFVPRPGATAEDDGVIVVPVIDLQRGSDSFLLILDAKTMRGIARALLPDNIPFGDHEMFLETPY